MTPREMLEPGILKAFRLFTGVRLALVIFTLLLYLFTTNWSVSNQLPFAIFPLVDVCLLLAYLWLPQLPSLLRRAYFPVGIVWATLGPIIQLTLVFFFIHSDLSLRTAFLLTLEPILVLFIPLVLVAWQYSFKVVMLFCGLTFLIDVVIIASAVAIYHTTSVGPLFGMAFIRTVLFLLIGNMIASLMQVQREQRQRLTRANDRLAQYAATLEQLTISRERNRMARELHDVMAHTMSGVAVELEGVRAMLSVDPAQAENLLGHSLSAVREGLTETRRALQALRAAPLEDLGLGLAVRSLAESTTGRAGLQTSLRIETDLGDTPVEVQQCFYRVAQEALTNIAAHAQARSVQVCLQRDGPLLTLSITDDGSGFDPQSVDLSIKYGLRGMRERVEMIHGNLSIASQAGAGTRIILAYDGGAAYKGGADSASGAYGGSI
jgi:signal transduction histidine kinase